MCLLVFTPKQFSHTVTVQFCILIEVIIEKSPSFCPRKKKLNLSPFFKTNHDVTTVSFFLKLNHINIEYYL